MNKKPYTPIETYLSTNLSLITHYKSNTNNDKYSKYKKDIKRLSYKIENYLNETKRTPDQILNIICLNLLLAAIECENYLRSEPKDRESKLLKTYFYSYPSIRKYFQYHSLAKYNNSKPKKEIFPEDIFLQGALMVYGWMPRIPSITPTCTITPSGISDNNIKSSINFLTEIIKLKNWENFQFDKNFKDNIDTLKQLVDNSLVAISKILHFTRPYEFPIWDTTICLALTDTENQSDNIDTYIDYISDFNKFFNKYNKEITKILPDKIWTNKLTLARLVELTIFLIAKQNQGQLRN